MGARHLEEYRHRIESIRAEARDLTAGLTEARFHRAERCITAPAEPPARQNMPAPRPFVPRHGHPVTTFLPTSHVQSRFVQVIDRSAAQAAAHDQARRVREKLPA